MLLQFPMNKFYTTLIKNLISIAKGVVKGIARKMKPAKKPMEIQLWAKAVARKNKNPVANTSRIPAISIKFPKPSLIDGFFVVRVIKIRLL